MTTQEKKDMSRLYFQEKYTFSAIGKIYGISRQRSHQIITGYKSFASHNYSYRNADLPNSICTKCNNKSDLKIDIHHIDRNSNNNLPSNLISLCQKCHYESHKGQTINRHYVRIFKKYTCEYCHTEFERPKGFNFDKSRYCSYYCGGQGRRLSK